MNSQTLTIVGAVNAALVAVLTMATTDGFRDVLPPWSLLLIGGVAAGTSFISGLSHPGTK